MNTHTHMCFCNDMVAVCVVHIYGGKGGREEVRRDEDH
jgi:hypothetical protein